LFYFDLFMISELHDQFTRTRAERVRDVLFPETMPDDGSAVPSPQYDANVSTSVQRLAQPSRMLKNAVVSLIHYQVSLSFIPFVQIRFCGRLVVPVA